MNRIVKIYITKMFETCNRTTFFVNLMSDEGYDMTVAGHRTGSDYTNGVGLTIEEARDRALIDAADWGDFLNIEPEPFLVDGIVVEPSMHFSRFTTRRHLKERSKNKNLPKE